MRVAQFGIDQDGCTAAASKEVEPVDPLIVAAITTFGVIAASYLTSRVSNRKLRSDAGQQMIDQHQEEIASLRAENASLRRDGRLKDDYIGQLRMHIADGRPPPPPSWPTSLTT